MSPDETFVVSLLRALEATGLEAIFIGNAAAALQGAPVTTQPVRSISGDLHFASLRSRSKSIPIAEHAATVASLEDIIRSKQAAGRPKDHAVLPILRDALRVSKALEQTDRST